MKKAARRRLFFTSPSSFAHEIPMPARMKLRRPHLRVPRLAVAAAGLGGDGSDLTGARLGVDVLCQLALRTFRDFERDSRALLERLEAVHRDRGEMREHVGASTIGLNESEALRVVEPFHRTCCHFLFLK